VHFEAVQRGLSALGIHYEIAPRLVRGLDYYSRTTFEFASEALESAQNALGGGGRYDRLAEEMGGPPAPGIGFGIGIERVLIACDAEETMPVPPAHLDAFVVDALVSEEGVEGAATEVSVLLHELREANLAADRAYGGRSVKAQWRAADRAGARYVVVVGRQEMSRGAVAVKDMETGEQEEVLRSRVVAWLREQRESAP
jgi:histidyl-tRNA synthetase